MTRRPAFELSVAAFLRQKRAQVEAESRITADEVAGYCTVCGYSHRPEDRRRALRRMLPCTLDDVRAEWPCWYSDGTRRMPSGRISDIGEKRFTRDMRALGAVFFRVGPYAGLWAIPETVRAARQDEACP